MIKVNLIGTAKTKTVKAAGQPFTAPASLLPAVLVAIVVLTAGFGYWWYSSLSTEVADLTHKIEQAEKQKTQLEAVIKEDQIYEARKKALDNRIKIIEGLKRNQVSPLLAVDILGDAIDKTQYVWLANLDQNNAIFSMSGTGTSVNAIADFVTNLEGTGHFRNINLVNAQDSAGNFTFSMTCEFSPPRRRAAGAN